MQETHFITNLTSSCLTIISVGVFNFFIIFRTMLKHGLLCETKKTCINFTLHDRIIRLLSLFFFNCFIYSVITLFCSITPFYNYPLPCAIEGVLLSYFLWSILLGILSISIWLTLSLKYKPVCNLHVNVEVMIYIIVYIFPIIPATVPLVFDVYKPLKYENYCWILNFEWRLWSYYIFVLLIDFVLVVLFLFNLFTLLCSKNITNFQKRDVLSLVLYPVIFILISIQPFVRIVIIQIYRDDFQLLALVEDFLMNIFGFLCVCVFFLNFVVFWFIEKVTEYKNLQHYPRGDFLINELFVGVDPVEGNCNSPKFRFKYGYGRFL